MKAGACFLVCGVAALVFGAQLVAFVSAGACFLMGLLCLGGVATFEIDFED